MVKELRVVIIVLDKCFFVHNLRLNSESHLQFWRFTECVNCKIVLPQIVYDEVIAECRYRLESAHSKFLRATSEAGGMISLEDTPIRSRDFVKTKLKDYLSWLHNELVARGVVVVPHPEIEMANLAIRSVHKQRPFRGDEREFQGLLIWETALACLSLGSGDPVAVIISRDKHLFMNQSGEWHADLIRHGDDSMGWLDEDLKIYSSIDAFVDAMPSERLLSREAPPEVSSLNVDVEHFERFEFGLGDTVSDYFDGAILDASMVSIPFGVSSVQVESVGRVLVISVDNTESLPSGRMVAMVSISVQLVAVYRREDLSQIDRFEFSKRAVGHVPLTSLYERCDLEVLLSVGVTFDPVTMHMKRAKVHGIVAGGLL